MDTSDTLQTRFPILCHYTKKELDNWETWVYQVSVKQFFHIYSPWIYNSVSSINKTIKGFYAGTNWPKNTSVKRQLPVLLFEKVSGVTQTDVSAELWLRATTSWYRVLAAVTRRAGSGELAFGHSIASYARRETIFGLRSEEKKGNVLV